MSRSLRLTLAVTLAIAAGPAAASAADFTWSGGAGVSTSGWSDPANWAGGVAPADEVGELSFPTPDNPLSPPGSCETSTDDIPNIQAQSLDLGSSHWLNGAALSIGAGGIQASTTGFGCKPHGIANPIVLTAPQSWLVHGTPIQGAAGTVALAGDITGAGDAVQLQFSGGAGLELGPDTEVGALSASGPGQLLIGVDPANGGPTSPSSGELNASDGNPVRIANGASLGSWTAQTSIGPLTSDGGTIYAGGTLSINGPLSINAGSVTEFNLYGNGQSDQINATGPVSLAGTLTLGAGVPSDAVTPGETFTLLTSEATISGTFDNAPQGALVVTATYEHDVQINYTPHAITATVADFGWSASPHVPVTNEPVTLSAGGPDYPAGSVTFSDFPTPAPPDASPVAIPGCIARPLAPSAGTSLTSCQTPFTTGLWGLNATFTQSAIGTSSLRDDASIVVKPASTTATVAASSPSRTSGAANARSGATVRYATTLRPQFAGPSHPTGNLSLVDHGRPVAACAGMRLTQSAAAQLAICTIHYTHAGQHIITGRYAGDVNFTGARSAPLTVTVPSASTERAIHVTRRGAVLRGRIRSERAAVTWRFMYWTSTGRARYTKRRRLSRRRTGVGVRIAVSGLRSGSRYRYRLIATTFDHQRTGPVSWTGRTLSLRTQR